MIRANEGYAAELKLDDLHRSQTMQDCEIDRLETEELPAYYKRRSAGVWICIATLTVALAVIVAYGYAILRQEAPQVEQVPGLARSLPAIAQHLANVERRLVDSRVDQQHLASNMQNIDAESKVALSQTQQQTSKRIANLKDSLVKGLNQQTVALQAQLSTLLSERKADQLRLAQVEDQLSQARSELVTAQRDFTSQLEVLHEQQGEQNRQLASVSNTLPVQQVPFIAQKNQQAEVVPGISFRLTKTDARRQRFDGTIESAPGNQKVSVQSERARSPIVLFPNEQGRAYVMVVTSVNQKEVIGYLLIPAKNGMADPTDFMFATENPHSPTSIPASHAASLVEP